VCFFSCHATQKVSTPDKQNKSKIIEFIYKSIKPSTVLVNRDDSRTKSVSLTMTLKLADASTEYLKDKDLKKDDVITFMTWVNKRPHLPEVNGEYDSKLAVFVLKWYLLQNSKPSSSCKAVTTGTRRRKLPSTTSSRSRPTVPSSFRRGMRWRRR
jgi:hypothetical protein